MNGLLQDVWGYETAIDTRTVDTHSAFQLSHAERLDLRQFVCVIRRLKLGDCRFPDVTCKCAACCSS